MSRHRLHVRRPPAPWRTSRPSRTSRHGRTAGATLGRYERSQRTTLSGTRRSIMMRIRPRALAVTSAATLALMGVLGCAQATPSSTASPNAQDSTTVSQQSTATQTPEEMGRALLSQQGLFVMRTDCLANSETCLVYTAQELTVGDLTGPRVDVLVSYGGDYWSMLTGVLGTDGTGRPFLRAWAQVDGALGQVDYYRSIEIYDAQTGYQVTPVDGEPSTFDTIEPKGEPWEFRDIYG